MINRFQHITITALIIALCSSVINIIVLITTKNISISFMLLSLLSFTMVYYISLALLRRVIKKRIKPLYHIISQSIPIKIKTTNFNLLEGEIKTWAERSKEEIEALKSMERYRKEFLGNVSHELKTPLFSLQGYIDTMLSGAMQDKEMINKYLERCDINVERLINIVKDLEGISSLENETTVLYKTNFDIVELFVRVSDTFENIIQEKGVNVNIDVSVKCFVNADRVRVEQIIINLLSNAVKYNKVQGSIFVNFEDVGDSVLISVSDTGVGVDAEHIVRIFERFYRVDTSRSRDIGGTGLGLSIVKHLLEVHGHTIRATSVANQGTTFFFTLDKGR